MEKGLVFVKSQNIELYDNNLVAHVILDPSKRAIDIEKLIKGAAEDKSNPEDLDEAMRYAGHFILISKKEIAKTDVLPTYYTRHRIEQIFGFAKLQIIYCHLESIAKKL